MLMKLVRKFCRRWGAIGKFIAFTGVYPVELANVVRMRRRRADKIET